MHASGTFSGAAHVHALPELLTPMIGVREGDENSLALASSDREFWLKLAAEAAAIATRLATREPLLHYAAQAEASKQAS